MNTLIKVFILSIAIAVSLVFPQQNVLLAQFSLDIVAADAYSIQIFVPSGTSDRNLLIRRSNLPDSIIALEHCRTSCQQQIHGLEPAELVYFALIRQADTLSRLWGITSSLSSGSIEVYFTTPVDEQLAASYPADGIGGAALEAFIIDRINSAQETIDAAFYNINRRSIVQALSAAYLRGVRVRYVTGDDTSNSALRNPTPPFPILIGNEGEPLMHHKFIVIDANLPRDALVITGATNMTTTQMYSDHNNTIAVYDQALAKVYQKEMDEMWGSSGPTPNLGLARFGAQKQDDTPHKIFIHGRLVESYFSPSDNTTFHITNALNRAQKSVYFALLTFTRSSLATSLIQLKNRGINIRGMIENIDDSGSEFNRLVGNGVFVLAHELSPQLHHKYAIIDALYPAGNPQVITGSHNWSNNAETNNDENTLILHDYFLTGVFLSEFQQRWCELFSDNNQLCRLTTQVLDHVQEEFRTVYDGRTLYLKGLSFAPVGAQVFDLNGRLIKAIRFYTMDLQHNMEISLPGLSCGVYVVSLIDHKGNTYASKFFCP